MWRRRCRSSGAIGRGKGDGPSRVLIPTFSSSFFFLLPRRRRLVEGRKLGRKQGGVFPALESVNFPRVITVIWVAGWVGEWVDLS